MTFGTIWAFFTAHKHAWWQIVLGILLFAAGWQLGRVMSPYYASHPIVFEDRKCSECSSSGGTAAELNALAEEGIAQRNPAPTVAGSAALGSSQQESKTAEQREVQPSSQSQGRFVGSVNSDKYHAVPECSSWKQIKEGNQIWFATVEEAERAGYSPTQCTSQLLEASN